MHLNQIVNDNNLEGSDDKKEEPAHRKAVCAFVTHGSHSTT